MGDNMKRVLFFSLLILISSIVLNSLLGDIADPDFFWHIATGEWIVKNRSIPTSDLFSYTTPGVLSERGYFILSQYWLAQSVYYFIYAYAGYTGIKMLSFLLAGLMIVFFWLRGRGTDIFIFTSILFLGLIVLFQLFPMERPQAFSFLFFSILILLLDTLVRDGRLQKAQATQECGKSYVFRGDFALCLIPPLMLIWSNIHGGYIIGQLVIILFILTEGLRILWPRVGAPMHGRSYRHLVISGGIGVLIALVNPNGYWATVYAASMPKLYTGIIQEYRSVPFLITNYWEPSLFIYLFLLLMAGLGTFASLFSKKGDVREIILFLGLGYFSFVTVRFMPFFIIWSVPFITRFLSDASRGGSVRGISILLAVGTFSFLICQPHPLGNLKNLHLIKTGSWVSSEYPEGAVRYLESNEVNGNMYNYHDWGGYLIWRLGPLGKKVFIDGRGLDEAVFVQAQQIVNADIDPEIAGKPFYLATLENYGVSYVVIPVIDMRGKILPIFISLFKNEEWKAVFLQGNCVILVKDIPENSSLISQGGITSEKLINDVIGILDGEISRSPQNHVLYMSKGDLLAVGGRYEEALVEYENALAVEPRSEIARKRLSSLGRR